MFQICAQIGRQLFEWKKFGTNFYTQDPEDPGMFQVLPGDLCGCFIRDLHLGDF